MPTYSCLITDSPFHGKTYGYVVARQRGPACAVAGHVDRDVDDASLALSEADHPARAPGCAAGAGLLDAVRGRICELSRKQHG